MTTLGKKTKRDNEVVNDTDFLFGIIGAMKVEVETLVNNLENKEIHNIYDLNFYTGKLKKYNVIIVKSGVGKVNAARTTQILIDNFHPTHIINTGIGGGLNDKLKVGDIVIAKDLIEHDFDVTALGYTKGYICSTGNDEKDKPTRFVADPDLSNKIIEAIKKEVKDINIFYETIVTGDIFISGKEKKEYLESQFKAFCGEMEGAAIGHVAYLCKIPFAVMRVISDLPSGHSPKDFNLFEKETAIKSCHILTAFLAS